MSEIIENLYLTGFKEAEKVVTDDTFVVNCTSDLPMLSKRGIRVSVEDNGRPAEVRKLITLLPEIVEVMHIRLLLGNKVLVHCAAGMQRSPAVVAAYLVARRHMSPEVAMNHVRSRHAEAFFWEARFRDAVYAAQNMVSE